MKRLTWIDNALLERDFSAPFIIKQDQDYYPDLQKRFKLLISKATAANADAESIKVITKYTSKTLEALRDYYKGSISTSHTKIKNLVSDCLNDSFAVDYVQNSDAFPGTNGTEIQFFRARTNPDGIPYEAINMLHLPFYMRGKTNNYRFSIPGIPSLYLGNSSYACWLELGRPSEHDFMVSPVVVDGSLRIFNLAVMNVDRIRLHEYEQSRSLTWLKLLILMIATSYRIEEKSRTFKSEYIISQSIMLACKELGLDGIAYYSKRVDNQVFGFSAVNLALFAPYKSGSDYSEICRKIKIDDSFNYALFRQLNAIARNNSYRLRLDQTGRINNIGNYRHQYNYRDTAFYQFDRFLFSGWMDKEDISFGNALPIS